MKEIIEMSTDTYLKSKYTLLADSRGQQNVEEFTRRMFSLTDRHRPLQIGMKEIE